MPNGLDKLHLYNNVLIGYKKGVNEDSRPRKMTKIFTFGTNGKSPKNFFEILTKNKIDLLLDIRLNNKSQLAGFAKGGDEYLGYLLNKITGIKYIYDPYFAPTDEILDKYRKDKNHILIEDKEYNSSDIEKALDKLDKYRKDKNWNNYVNGFNKIIETRNFKKYFQNKYNKYSNVCLLCAEETPEQCHRRLVAESIINKKDINHL